MSYVSIKCAVSNTGPLISVFQSEQTELLKAMYDRIYVPESALSEYIQHGSKKMLEELTETKFVVSCGLDASEKQTAEKISIQIANHKLAKSRDPQKHYSEAEAIMLMERIELQALEIILDEQAAREIAKERGIFVVGYAGILVRCCREGHVTAEGVREILMECRAQGTYYATSFIDGIYRRLKGKINEK